MLKIKKFGVLKMASFMGLFSLLFGLIFAILMWILYNVFSSMIVGNPYETGGIGTLSLLPSLSFMSLLIIPVVYGIIGFISGLIFTPIMNLVFRIIGGVDIDIEESSQ